MAECVRCQKESGTAKFCPLCADWLKTQADGLGNEISAWMAKWLAWEAWCSEHGQQPT